MDYTTPEMEILDISVGDEDEGALGPSGMPDWFPGIY